MKSPGPALTLREQAAAGGRWTAMSAVVAVGVQFAQLAALGRLLDPSDFGLLAMMTVVIGLAGLLADLGVANYIVQARSLPDRQVCGLLLLCAAASAGLAVVVAATAPAVARYYHEQRLAQLLPVMSLMIVATAVGQPLFALLQRGMKFRIIAIADMLSGVAGLLVAVGLALRGDGVWALVVAQLVVAATKACLLGVSAFPMLHWGGALSWAEAGAALRFGAYQMGERVLNYAGANVDKLVVGRLLGDGALGVYSVAYQLAVRPAQLLNPVFARVTLPLFSRIQNDDDRLSRGYLQTVRTIAVISFPVYLVLVVAAYSIVKWLLGPKWLEAVSLLSVLGGLGFFFSLGNPIGSLLLAKGRVDLGFYYNLVAVCLYVAVIGVCSRYGLDAVAVGILLVVGGILFPLEFALRWLCVRMTPATYWHAIRKICLAAAVPLVVAELGLRLLGGPGRFAGVDVLFGLLAAGGCYGTLWFTERQLLLQTLELFWKR